MEFRQFFEFGDKMTRHSYSIKIRSNMPHLRHAGTSRPALHRYHLVAGWLGAAACAVVAGDNGAFVA